MHRLWCLPERLMSATVGSVPIHLSGRWCNVEQVKFYCYYYLGTEITPQNCANISAFTLGAL